MRIEKDIIYPEESFRIVGASMAVHSHLGCGFLEQVYQEALEIEFNRRGIPYEREKEIIITYRGIPLKKTYKADFVCYNKIIVELKALSATNGDHIAQVLNYLKATQMELGLLINFGKKSLEYERVLNGKEEDF